MEDQSVNLSQKSIQLLKIILLCKELNKLDISTHLTLQNQQVYDTSTNVPYESLKKYYSILEQVRIALILCVYTDEQIKNARGSNMSDHSFTVDSYVFMLKNIFFDVNHFEFLKKDLNSKKI